MDAGTKIAWDPISHLRSGSDRRKIGVRDLIELDENVLLEVYDSVKSDPAFSNVNRALESPPAVSKTSQKLLSYEANRYAYSLGVALLESPQNFSMSGTVVHASADPQEIQKEEDPTTASAVFIEPFLKNVRDLLCKSDKTVNKEANITTRDIVASLAAAIVTSLGISSPVATGLAALILLIVLKAVHKTLCEIDDEKVKKLIGQKRFQTRHTESRQPQTVTGTVKPPSDWVLMLQTALGYILVFIFAVAAIGFCVMTIARFLKE